MIFKKDLFEGRVAVVTGASRGIGRAAALQLGQLGCRVLVNYYISEEGANEVRNLILGQNGEADIFRADVSDRGQVNAMIEYVLSKWGKVDFLINNAGKKIDQIFLYMEEEWDEVMKINLQGVFNCCKEAVPHMIEQMYGRIINLSSISAFAGGVGISNYAASKSALIGLTKSLSKELAGYNINVNVVSPGIIDTEMTRRIPKDLLKQIPLRRMGKVEEVAGVVCFLLCEAADYITGQVISVDGGMR